MAESRKGTASKDSEGETRAEQRQETATQLDSIFERISNLRKILKKSGNATKSSGECSSSFVEKAENSYSRSSQIRDENTNFNNISSGQETLVHESFLGSGAQHPINLQ
jgi:hypothetical protein